MLAPTMSAPTILQLQSSAHQGYLYFSVAVLCGFNSAVGSCYVYGGLTLEHHLQEEGAGVDQEVERQFLSLTSQDASWYMSLVPIMTVVGTLVGYPLGEWLGRRTLLILSSITNILGFLVMYLSTDFLLLAAGRCISTFGIGAGVMMPFVLISEISTIKARAPLSVINTLSISIGILATFVFVFIFPAHLLIFFSSGLSLLFLLTSPFLPESPHFLIRRGKLEEARKVINMMICSL